METEPLLTDRDDRSSGASDAGRLHGWEGEQHLCRFLLADGVVIRCRQVALPPSRHAVVRLPVLNGRRRDAEHSCGFANPADRRNDLVNVFHDLSSTVSVHDWQGGCATFRLARITWAAHQLKMDTSEKILAALRERNVTHARIASVLNVTTNNATRLYNPDPKTGKTRKLSFDEGMALITAFDLDNQDEDRPIEPMSLPVARLAVQYIAQQLGVRIDPDDERVEDLALDIRAYSEFAASSQIGENLDRAEGWLDGRRSRLPART